MCAYNDIIQLFSWPLIIYLLFLWEWFVVILNVLQGEIMKYVVLAIDKRVNLLDELVSRVLPLPI
jgi:hypothetical protein